MPEKGIVSFHGCKTAALLVYLAVEAGQSHSRAAPAALLWPELPEDFAHNNLRVASARLSNSLGSGFIQGNRQGLHLNSAFGLRLDVFEFQTLLEQTLRHTHLERTNCAECHPKLVRAAQLYRGEFLENFVLEDCSTFDKWQLMRREQYRLQALEQSSAYQKLLQTKLSKVNLRRLNNQTRMNSP